MLKESPDESHQLAELEEQLISANIAFTRWGQAGTKRVIDLLHEIQKGESLLVFTNTGEGVAELLRQVYVAGIKIFYRDETTGNMYKLRETRQVFKDGRGERRRHLEGSLLEKMKPNEDPEQAMKRGITEEIGIPTETFKLIPLDVQHQLQESPSYPGLKTEYVLFLFEMHMQKKYYNPDGYKEEQHDKTTYFEWQQES